MHVPAGSVVRVRASNEPGESATQAGDFDAYIMKMADAWEKSENKVGVRPARSAEDQARAQLLAGP